MKRNELEDSPLHDAAEKEGAGETRYLALEPSRPLLALDGEGRVRDHNLEPAGAQVIDEEWLVRSRTWGRRRGRAWVRRTSRLTAD